MEEATDLAGVLGRFVERSGYNVGQLSRLADIPKRTIANWLGGQVSRPRHVADLLKLAAVLHLDERETSALLAAAGHPPVPQLLAATGDEDTRELLARTVARHQEMAPFQAIPDLPYFVGRQQEVRALRQVLLGGGRALLCSLQGMGGVGKTALAAHLVYQLRPYFPDGVLWARADQGDPMSILSAFAHAYGCDVSLYADLESRGQVVREILADKRALIVLDNVQESKAVEPLLPPSVGTCAVIITTRRQNLAVTSGAHRFTVGPFDKTVEEAIELFVQILGEERVRRETHTLRQIANLLGHLPLAVAIAASRMAYEPGWSASEFLKQLQQEKKRLDVLTYENLSVRLSTNLSYDLLPAEEQRFFAALGAFRGENLNLEAIAHVTKRPLEAVQAALRKLYGLSLVQVGQGERYRLHPLLHDYAREQLMSSDERQAILARMVAFYAGYVEKHRQNYDALEIEIDNILAALEAGFHEEMFFEVVRATNNLYFFLEMRGLHDLAAIYLNRAWDAARFIDDDVSLATVLLHLGHLLRKRGEYTAAELTLAEGLALARRSMDKALTSAFLGELGMVLAFLGRPSAESYCNESFVLAQKLGYQELICIALNNLGTLARKREAYEKAERYHQEALAVARRLSQNAMVRLSLDKLAELALAQMEYEEAERFYREVLALARESEEKLAVCNALLNLGQVLTRRGAEAEVAAHFGESLTLARQGTNYAAQARLLNEWGDLLWQGGILKAATTAFTEALALAEAGNCEKQAAAARDRLARCRARHRPKRLGQADS